MHINEWMWVRVSLLPSMHTTTRALAIAVAHACFDRFVYFPSLTGFRGANQLSAIHYTASVAAYFVLANAIAAMEESDKTRMYEHAWYGSSVGFTVYFVFNICVMFFPTEWTWGNVALDVAVGTAACGLLGVMDKVVSAWVR